MPFPFNQYPYQNLQDFNLDYILKTMKTLRDDYGTLTDFFENLNDWKAGIDEDVARCLRELAAYDSRFEQLSNDVTTSMNALQTALESEISSLETSLNNEISLRLNEVDLAISALTQEIANRITDLTNALFAQIQTNDAIMKAYIDVRFQEFIDELPEWTTENILVHNPVTGETEPLNKTLYDIYEVSRAYALTAEEYDSLGLTASEYDALNMTAFEFDNYSKNRLGLGVNMIRSPFDGTYISVERAINELAALHMNALTATEYDALEMDADTYDALELTAHDYDWNGAALV